MNNLNRNGERFAFKNGRQHEVVMAANEIQFSKRLTNFLISTLHWNSSLLRMLLRLYVLSLQWLCYNAINNHKPNVDDKVTEIDYSKQYASLPGALQDCKGAQESQQMVHHKRLQNLRKEMSTNDVTTYILLGVDLNLENYRNKRKNVISYLTGYRGQFAALVVAEDTSSIYLDETYKAFTKISLTNLSCSWTVGWIEERRFHLDKPHKTIVFTAPFRRVLELHMSTLNITVGKKIGFYRRHMPVHAWNEWINVLQYKIEENNLDVHPESLLVALHEELITKIWDIDEDNPRPAEHILMSYYLQNKYTGQGWREKVQAVREKLTEHRATAILITEYDEISYLLNIRSNNFRYTSLVEGNLVVDYFRIWVFNASPLTKDAFEEFDKPNIGVVFVDMYDEELVRKRLNMVSDQGIILVTDEISYFLYDCLNLRNAYTYLTFMSEAKRKVENKTDYTEYQALVELVYFLRKDPLHRGISEPSISAFGPSTAIVAYRARDVSAAIKSRSVSTMGVYMADTSNHYVDGTATIARTFHFGTPSKLEEAIYTRLLQGLIQVAMLHFPPEVTDNDLEGILLAPLRGMGLTTDLEVGHGIGTFTNLRELPLCIRRKAISENFVYLRPGMMIAFEPQYFFGEEFGIKLKSTFEVVLSNLSHNKKTPMYTFSPVTYFPFEENLIREKLLSIKEKRWLNGYYSLISRKLGNFARTQIDRDVLKFLMDRLKKKFKTDNPVCTPPKASSSTNQTNKAVKPKRSILFVFGILCLTLYSV